MKKGETNLTKTVLIVTTIQSKISAGRGRACWLENLRDWLSLDATQHYCLEFPHPVYQSNHVIMSNQKQKKQIILYTLIPELLNRLVSVQVGTTHSPHTHLFSTFWVCKMLQCNQLSTPLRKIQYVV